jgi:hypothetical protein
MRMPSTRSPWLPLACSFALHSLVFLGGWLFCAGAPHRSVTCGTCVQPTHRLALTAIFGNDAPAPRPGPIDTKTNDAVPAVTPPTFPEIQPFVPPLDDSARAVSPPVTPSGNAAGPAVGGAHSTGGNPGAGPGVPGGTSFFQVNAAAAKSVVFVIDRSLSMSLHGALDRARLELATSLRRLAPDTQVQVIAYNLEPTFLLDPEQLVPARPDVIDRFALAANALDARGKTNHVKALRRALFLHPEVIYLVTDGGAPEDMSPRDVQELTALGGGKTAIHVIELVSRGGPRLDDPLARLAANNSGTFQRLAPDQVTQNQP